MKCPLCEIDQPFLQRYQLHSFQIAECSHCGVLLNQTYHENLAFREGLFEKDYYEQIQREAFKYKLDNMSDDPSVKVFQESLNRIQQYQKPGRLLDVGCAFGTFLKVAQDHGWTPCGVELSKYAATMAREKWGFDIFNGDLNQCPFEAGSFDLISFWDVIEHVPTPRENLEKAYDLLKPGGFLLMTTDNFHSLIAFIARFIYQASFGKISYPVKRFFIPHNTFYFTPNVMRRFLNNSGFKIIHFEGIDYPLEKINSSLLEKGLLRILYQLGILTGLRSQFLLIAQRQ